MKLKKLFYLWAYLDVEHTCDRKRTYFGCFAGQNGHKNLVMIRWLAAFFAILSIIVVGVTTFLLKAPGLNGAYLMVLVAEVLVFALATILLKKNPPPSLCTLLSLAYLVHFLFIAGYIGTVLSPDESASIYLVALILSQMLFLLPPILTTPISAVATVLILITDYYIKTPFFFRIDLLNCIGVFVLSCLVGWLVGKMRAEEAFTQTRILKLNDELKQMSVTDQLTGLPNHRSFQEVYYALFESARATGRRIGVIVLDIDQFKAFNDNYGHVEGDKCLAAIGGALRSCKGDGEFVCRFGGEEFLILLEGEVCDRAYAVAEGYRRCVSGLGIPHGFSRAAGVVTVSAGLYVGAPETDDMPMSLVDKADRAMYQSKADGGDRTTDFGNLRLFGTADDNLTRRARQSLRRKVLVVDDNTINRKLLHRILSDDYDVVEADNGRTALDRLSRPHESISAVLLDIVMPVMDGFELLGRMQADALLCQIPVLIMTGETDESVEIRALSQGAQDFIKKPYNPSVVLHRVKNAINLRETAAIVTAVERDELTGAYSKEFFAKKAEQLLRVDDKKKYDIICCDVARFTLVNELFGEKTGDRMLKYIADLLRGLVKDDGICGRIGADQFACLLPHRDTYDDGFFSELSRAVNRFPVSISIDVCFGIYPAANPDEGVGTICDRALLACSSIKNRYDVNHVYYDETLTRRLVSEQLLIDGVKAGIERGEFVVYYQPEYELDGGAVAGAEALVRWKHPDKGLMQPAAFIPVLEKSGLIAELDAYVWETVCRDAADRARRGLPELPISVNVSRADIYNPALPQQMKALVDKYGLAPELLRLEITETAYSEDSMQLINAVVHLRGEGFQTAMDDFGTGYSSLNMLAELPINTVKLDRAFVSANILDERGIGMLKHIVGLANFLELPVVAEGVETAQQEQVMRDMGCRYAQGYYFARPMPGEDFDRYLSSLDAAGRPARGTQSRQN